MYLSSLLLLYACNILLILVLNDKLVLRTNAIGYTDYEIVKPIDHNIIIILITRFYI